MIALLLDENIEGRTDRLRLFAEGPSWIEFRDYLDLEILVYEDVGLVKGTSDEELWEFCVSNRYLLLTDNRNENCPDSLRAMIKTRNGPDVLPVFTIGNIQRFDQDEQYAKAAIDQLYEYLFDLENHLGVGRLFLP